MTWDLAKEFELAKKAWGESTTLQKFAIVVSVVSTASTIASLSETIFKWKGFILDGVNLYRLYIAEPIAMILNLIGPPLNGLQVDLTILYIALTSCVMRAVYYGRSIRWFPFRQIREAMLALLACIVLMKLNLFDIYMGEVCLAILVLTWIYWPFMRSYSSRDQEEWSRVKSVYFVTLFAIVSSVLVLGAVNSGLSHGAQ